MNQFTENEKLIIDFDSLYESMNKCKVGVTWKNSVKSYLINSEENIHRLHNQLESRTFKNGKPKPILITYPKRREALSITFKDRIYQRSINDNILYPAMTKSFVYSNVACQKEKGNALARKLINKYLWKFYRHHGLNGYILQLDIKGYYKNMSHQKVLDDFYEKLDSGTYSRVEEILNHQYKGKKGYNPGSQMVQIAGISHPNDLDHFIKEKLHIDKYIRFMDDFFIIHESKEYLEEVLEAIKNQLQILGLNAHPKKTHIQPISKPFIFLGFVYRVTKTGKVVTFVKPQSIKHCKRKTRKMMKLYLKGEVTKAKIDECFNAFLNHVSQGNTPYLQIKRLKKWYKNQWKEINDEVRRKQYVNSRTSCA